jgi:hypothetical protein
MSRQAVQEEIPGFEQKRIPAIERWASKYDDKRETINGLEGELANIELKLRETVHANEADVDQQQSEDGDQLFVYKRPGFNVVVKRGKEKVNVKLGDKQKGDVPPEDQGE